MISADPRRRRSGFVLLRCGAAVGRRWRRSLQTRVVVTTLVVSGVVVLLLATLLLDQIGRGLVAAKTRSALSEAQAGLLQAQGQILTSLDRPKGSERAAVEAELQIVAQQLSDRGATGGLYDIVLIGPQNAKSFASQGADPTDIPAQLVRELGAGRPGYAYGGVPDGADARVPGIIVGAVLNTAPSLGSYTLYHLFPLTAEEQTLALVRRTAAGAGSLLVLLLAGIVGLVARQVVLPVRLAARTAELLASGRLEERIVVRGEDEIARLGETFNAMAAALQRQIRQLEDLSRLQRRFVSDVSNELRTPLTTVRMAAEVLYDQRSAFPPAASRSAELLRGELDRFEGMLSDLLEISRYDAGVASLEAEEQDLIAVVLRVVAQVQPLADARGLPFDLSGLPAGPLLVEFDHVRIERVLRNLLVNAVEHGERRPVAVQVAGDASAVAVVIRDHGVGLRLGEAGLVFTRFWRGDPSRARTTGGTGLGLAIALEDVRLHGGWLQAWGEPGQGASFRMVLPRVVRARFTHSPLPLEPDEVLA